MAKLGSDSPISAELRKTIKERVSPNDFWRKGSWRSRAVSRRVATGTAWVGISQQAHRSCRKKTSVFKLPARSGLRLDQKFAIGRWQFNSLLPVTEPALGYEKKKKIGTANPAPELLAVQEASDRPIGFGISISQRRVATTKKTFIRIYIYIYIYLHSYAVPISIHFFY